MLKLVVGGLKVKVKESLYRHGQDVIVPGFEVSRLRDIPHINVVKLSALYTAPLYHPPPRKTPGTCFC